MERREFVALLGAAAALMPAALAKAEPVPRANAPVGLAGAWEFQSSVNTRRDGSTFDRWGPNPKGIFIFAPSGHYAQVIMGSESRFFGSKTYSAFGTYVLDESGRFFTTTIEGCSVSKLAGAVQRREIHLLTANMLRYSNPITATDSIAEVLWKRLT